MKNFETPRQNGCSYEKGSLGRDMPSVGTLVGLLLALTWWAASALLELSSSTSSSWRGLCRQPDWAPHRLGARALAPWACSWSLQGHETNSAASGTSGSSKRFFCHQWSVCSNTLASPFVVLGRLARGRTKLANLLQEGSWLKILSLSAFLCALKDKACRHSCKAPVEVGLWSHNAMGHWAYQAKKEEEEQINVVLFVNEN